LPFVLPIGYSRLLALAFNEAPQIGREQSRPLPLHQIKMKHAPCREVAQAGILYALRSIRRSLLDFLDVRLGILIFIVVLLLITDLRSKVLLIFD
jgi:hypothetical protein